MSVSEWIAMMAVVVTVFGGLLGALWAMLNNSLKVSNVETKEAFKAVWAKVDEARRDQDTFQRAVTREFVNRPEYTEDMNELKADYRWMRRAMLALLKRMDVPAVEFEDRE